MALAANAPLFFDAFQDVRDLLGAIGARNDAFENADAVNERLRAFGRLSQVAKPVQSTKKVYPRNVIKRPPLHVRAAV
jgi:hypothetical protein